MDEKLRLIVEGLSFTLTNEQQDFLVKFINGKGNWSLLGDAGVGKSTIIADVKIEIR